MEKFLSTTRWILHKLFIILLGSAIWFFVPIMALGVNITDQNVVKNWLIQSNSYETVLNESFNLIEVEADGQTISEKSDSSSLDEAALLASIKSAITPDFLQSQTEQAISGTYSWLRGESINPDFKVSLKEKSDQIEQALTAELTRQLSALPACTSVQQSLDQANADVLEVTCLPPGVSASEQAQKFASDFVDQADGVVQSELTGDEIFRSIGGESSNTWLPVSFNLLELVPVLFWLSLFAFSAIILLTSKSIRSGLKEVGATMIVASSLLLLGSFVGTRLSTAPGKLFTDPQNTDANTEAVRNIVEPLLKSITSDVAQSGMVISAVVFVLGLASIILAWYIGKKIQPSDHDDNSVPELMRDDHDSDFIDKAHKEKQTNLAKPKIKDKIKRRLVQ